MDKRRKRLIILTLLAVASALYRGADIYQTYSRPSAIGSFGFDTEVVDGHLVVKSVDEKDRFGRVTPASRAGLKAKDRIIALYSVRGEGGRLGDMFDFGAALGRIAEGEISTIVVSRGPKGNPSELRMTLPGTGPSEAKGHLWHVVLALHVLLPLLALLTAFFVGFMRPEDDNAFTGSLLFTCFSTIFGVWFFAFPPLLRELGFFYLLTGQSFALYLFMRFFLLFPSPSLIDRKAPWLKTVMFGWTVATWLTTILLLGPQYLSFEMHSRLWNVVKPYENAMNWALGNAPTLLMLFVGIASLVLNTIKASTKDEKRRMVILLTGTIAGLLPLTVVAVFMGGTGGPQFSLGLLVLISATLALFPLSFIYVVVKHRVFGIRVILRRGLQYALVSRGFRLIEGLLVFALLYVVARHLFAHFRPGAGPVAISASSVMLTLGAVKGLKKLHAYVTPRIDRRFFRDAYNAQRILTDLGRAVRTLAAQPDQLLRLVADQVSDSLYPTHVAIFLRASEGGRVRLTGSGEAAPHDDGDGHYQCFRLRQRSDGTTQPAETPEMCASLVLPPDAFIPRHLASLAEPEALDVYIDNPKSWASALIRADAHADLFREKEIVQALNTRLIVPLRTHDRLLGFLALGEKLSEEPYSKEDKELLTAVAQQVSIALDYAQLVRQVADQEKLKRELEIAKEVQARLFPQTLPEVGSLDYACVCRAARGVAGDYYDFLPIGEDRIAIAIADVSGKGIGAALLMASLQALLRSHAPLRGLGADGLVGDINRLMCRSTDFSKYATFFYAIYDDRQRTLTYVNAGHNPPMLLRPARSTRSLPSGLPAGPAAGVVQVPQTAEQPLEMIRLETGGMVVGLFDDAAYQTETVLLKAGDTLVLFTDGVSEALNGAGEEFGEARLSRVVSGVVHLPARQILDKVLAKLDAFVGDAPQYDDVTLVVARVTK